MIVKKNRTIEPVFIERPVPTMKQAKAFENAVKMKIHNEEVKDELLEIYGQGGDFNKMNLKPRANSTLFLVIKKLFVAAVLFCFAYGIFYYFSNRPADATAFVFTISAPEKVKAGEKFDYTVHYKNSSKFVLKNMRLELKYPDSFILMETKGISIQANKGNAKNVFLLNDLNPGQEAEIIISGKIINKKDSVALLSAGLSYYPGDFSSEFKKETLVSTIVDNLGFDVNFEYSNTALAGEKNEIDIYFKDIKENFLDDFDVSFMFPENIILVNGNNASTTATSSEELLKIEKNASLLWNIKGLVPSDKTYKLPIYYQVKKKLDDNQEIIIRFNKKDGNGASYIFLEKSIKLNIMNSNLNLTLILNGSKGDGSVNFGDTLNYSLTYANKSDSEINDIAIMAILKSDFLDWTTLKSVQKGFVSGQSIIWNKEQLPALASLAPGEEGVIDFSITLKAFSENDLGKDFSVNSLAQFNINNHTGNSSDSKSNTIITKINSDFNLIDKILYFDDNNMPVGSGPLPPKVGEQTTFKVYWTLENNLHNLNDVKVTLKLPDYVDYNYKDKTTLGALSYDPSTRIVSWDISTLPVATYKSDAEFSISIKPTESDRDRILVLSPGASLSAIDQETKAVIIKKINPKTTRLEDDNIAGLNNSGRVQ